MGKRKELWIGISIGFFFAAIFFGALILIRQITDHKNPELTDQVNTDAASGAFIPTQSPEEGKYWEGTWTRTGDTKFEDAKIDLKYLGEGKIEFTITSISGGNSGTITGNTFIKEGRAVYSDPSLGYRILLQYVSDSLEITSDDDSGTFFSEGVTFAGTYKKGIQEKKETDFILLGVLEDEAQAEAFRELVKEDYALFQDAFQLCDTLEDLDGFTSRVSMGSVRGISGKGAVVMAGPDHTFWAAVTDGSNLNYYTNSKDKEYLPVTIDLWRNELSEYEIRSAETGEPMKVLTLKELINRGFKTMKAHTFTKNIEGFGSVRFVSGTVRENGIKRAEYYILNAADEVLYKFPAVKAGVYVRTRAVSFQNIGMDASYEANGNPADHAAGQKKDSKKNPEEDIFNDIIIIEEYKEPAKEFGDIPFPYCRIYSQASGRFLNRMELYDGLNEDGKNENVTMILEYLKDRKEKEEVLHREDVILLEDQTRTVVLRDLGEVEFVAARVLSGEKKQLKLCLADASHTLLYDFAVPPTDDSLKKILGIKIKDINQDGLEDVVALAEYSKVGEKTGYPVCLIYLQTGEDFIYLEELSLELNKSGKIKDHPSLLSELEALNIRLNISDIKNHGITIRSDSILPIRTEGWGKVKFVPGQRKGIGAYELVLYLMEEDGTILYQLPKLTERDCHSIREAVLHDVNRDEIMDLILIANYTTGFGTDGITPAPYCNIFLQTAGGFVNLPKLDLEINYRSKADRANKVIKYLESLGDQDIYDSFGLVKTDENKSGYHAIP